MKCGVDNARAERLRDEGRDPDDDKLLETALTGEADCLVTGDRDLLVMAPFHGIPILTPAAFLTATRTGEA